MKARSLAVICAVMAVTALEAPAAQAAKPPDTWDDLVLVKSKRLDRVYLLPGADFRPYNKVMLDPTEVAFRKNWIREYNTSSKVGRIGQKDAERIQQEVSTGFGDIFAKAYQQAGYQVVQSPGPDVLRVRTAVINLSATAPDLMTAGRSRTFSDTAGEATLILEARDSLTGAILGRAVDREIADDSRPYLRNSVSNRSDFSRMFSAWAKASVAGLAQLKAQSPGVTATAATNAATPAAATTPAPTE